MAKSDVDAAFRRVNIHPEHAEKINYVMQKEGFQHVEDKELPDYLIDKLKDQGQVYQETRLPFGLKCSMMHFQRYTYLARLIMLRRGITKVLVYVDDYLVIDTTRRGCQRKWSLVNELLGALGLQVCTKPQKLVKPTQHIKFLGIWISTNEDGKGKCTLRLDPEKLQVLRAQIRKVIHMAKNDQPVTRHELDVMLGRMAHLQQTVYSAKGFYANIIRLRHSKDFTGKLTKGFLHDARFWLEKIDKFDGKAIIVARPQLSKEYWATDAAIEKSSVGIGSYFGFGL